VCSLRPKNTVILEMNLDKHLSRFIPHPLLLFPVGTGRASCAEGNGRARRAAWANMARCLALNWHGLAADGLNWQHTGCMHRPCVCVGDEGVYVFQKMVRQIFWSMENLFRVIKKARDTYKSSGNNSGTDRSHVWLHIPCGECTLVWKYLKEHASLSLATANDELNC